MKWARYVQVTRAGLTKPVGDERLACFTGACSTYPLEKPEVVWAKVGEGLGYKNTCLEGIRSCKETTARSFNDQRVDTIVRCEQRCWEKCLFLQQVEFRRFVDKNIGYEDLGIVPIKILDEFGTRTIHGAAILLESLPPEVLDRVHSIGGRIVEQFSEQIFDLSETVLDKRRCVRKEVGAEVLGRLRSRLAEQQGGSMRTAVATAYGKGGQEARERYEGCAGEYARPRRRRGRR